MVGLSLGETPLQIQASCSQVKVWVMLDSKELQGFSRYEGMPVALPSLSMESFTSFVF